MATLNRTGIQFPARSFYVGISLTVIVAAYILSTAHTKTLPRQKPVESLKVAISPAVQVVLSGGDSFLAANLAAFRATMVTVEELDPADYAVLAKVQDDASQLNPAQGDNYYIAQGVLPWVGEHRTAINILERSTRARPGDFLPPYFLGFDYMYFEGEFAKSGAYYRLAADRVSGSNRDALLNHAARFMEKSKDPATAIQFINGLIKATRNQGLQQFLRVRIQRLEGLIALREAATKYQQLHQRPPRELRDLVESRVIANLPIDPLGIGYRLDEQGVPQIIFQIKRIQ